MFILILILIPIVLFILIFNMILIPQNVSSFHNQIKFNQTPEFDPGFSLDSHSNPDYDFYSLWFYFCF